MKIGFKLKQARLSLKLRRKQFSEKLGIKEATVFYYENDVFYPSILILKKYHDIFNIDLNELLGLKPKKEELK